MSVIKEEFLVIKFSRLIRDQDAFPTTTVIIDSDLVNSIIDYSRDLALLTLGSPDPSDVSIISTVST